MKRSGKRFEAEVMEARRSSPWLWPLLAILLIVGVVALQAVVMSSYGGRTRWLDLSPGGDDVYLARVVWETDGAALLAEVQSRDQKALRLVQS